MQPLPKDHPIMKAWDAYVATPDFANSKRWAVTLRISPSGDRQFIEHPHVDGSMWAAFLAGFRFGEASARADGAVPGNRTPVP
jgi:hypothetical protein